MTLSPNPNMSSMSPWGKLFENKGLHIKHKENWGILLILRSTFLCDNSIDNTGLTSTPAVCRGVGALLLSLGLHHGAGVGGGGHHGPGHHVGGRQARVGPAPVVAAQGHVPSMTRPHTVSITLEMILTLNTYFSYSKWIRQMIQNCLTSEVWPVSGETFLLHLPDPRLTTTHFKSNKTDLSADGFESLLHLACVHLWAWRAHGRWLGGHGGAAGGRLHTGRVSGAGVGHLVAAVAQLVRPAIYWLHLKPRIELCEWGLIHTSTKKYWEVWLK